MSDENTTQQEAAPNSEVTTETSKGRRPDFIVHNVTGDDKNSNWTQVGAAWEGKSGYIKAKITAMSINGELTLQPREELERLRQERKDRQPIQQQTKDISQKL